MKNASKTVLVAEIGSVAINLKGVCKSAIADLGPVTWFPLTRLYGFHIFCQFWFLDVSRATKVAYSVPALGLLVVNMIGFIEWYLTDYFPGVSTVWFWMASFITYGLYGAAFRMNSLRC
ncbi:hypothetical protein CYMTET_31750 [Cymbomonas tetramitiformis]|uniref:Uncharacterized protein n=1 Tax=Cymbomonas tetramitiformis TaxID=36881 RepID=A0AAE0FGN8_9CHLO|nr:hypothetical protein CYMTET_31750 [Cymbomonas tetramitiformis]